MVLTSMMFSCLHFASFFPSCFSALLFDAKAFSLSLSGLTTRFPNVNINRGLCYGLSWSKVLTTDGSFSVARRKTEVNNAASFNGRKERWFKRSKIIANTRILVTWDKWYMIRGEVIIFIMESALCYLLCWKEKQSHWWIMINKTVK